MLNDEKQTALFLGSGATAGSGIKKRGQSLPTDQNFFSEENEKNGVPKIIDDWERKYPALHLCRQIRGIHSASLYQTWNQLFIYRGLALGGVIREDQETIRKFRSLANHEWPKNFEWRAQHYELQFRLLHQSLLPIEYFLAELAIWDLRTLIKEVYDDEDLDKSSEAYNNFLEKLKNNKAINKPAAVINLNYDTTFDDVNSKRYYYPGDGKPAKGKVPIIRPHGSLKWTSQSCWHLNQGWTGWKDSYDETPLTEMGYKPTGKSMLLDFQQPLIVSPANFKEEVIGNSSILGLQNPILRQQWQYLNQILTDCDHWMFLGISFASGDEHLLWLLKHAYKCCKTKISCFIKNDCQPVQKLIECLGHKIEMTAYKIENETIDKFTE